MEKRLYITADWNKYDKTFTYYFRTYECKSEVLVEERVVSFDSLDDAELRRKMHAILLQKRKDVLADAYAEATEIEAIANEMLAIEDHSNDPPPQQPPSSPAKGADDDFPF